jgi:hypothetical protein
MESAIVEARIGSLLEERAGAEHDRHGEPLHAGSGWGRSSRFGVRCRRRNPRRSSIACSPVPALAKTRSRGLPSWKRASCRLERRAPMLLPSPGRTFSKGRRTRPQRCCTGVVRWNASHLHAAVEAWEAAYALEPDSWLALRNIAAASGLLGEPERSAEQYLRALDLTPDVAQLRLEAIEALIAVNRFSEAVALAQAAPESSFAGRFRFLQAWAAVLHGEIRLAESILEGGLEVADLREGEVSLSDLWRICRRRCIETGGDAGSIKHLREWRAPTRTCPSSMTSGCTAELPTRCRRRLTVRDRSRVPGGGGSPRRPRPPGPCPGTCGGPPVTGPRPGWPARPR